MCVILQACAEADENCTAEAAEELMAAVVQGEKENSKEAVAKQTDAAQDDEQAAIPSECSCPPFPNTLDIQLVAGFPDCCAPSRNKIKLCYHVD